jgi:hypothetical protein
MIRLEFENNTRPWSSDKIRHIVHVLQQSFDATLDPADVEWEYAVKDSMLQVPRTYQDKTQDAFARNVPVDPPPELQPFHQPGRPLVWETPKPGATGINPYFVDNAEISTTDVPSGMVEVEAKAFGLNFREVMVGLGELDEPFKGHECAGIITALGPDTEASGLKVGDRVCALVRGRLASRGRTRGCNRDPFYDKIDSSFVHCNGQKGEVISNMQGCSPRRVSRRKLRALLSEGVDIQFCNMLLVSFSPLKRLAVREQIDVN